MVAPDRAEEGFFFCMVVVVVRGGLNLRSIKWLQMFAVYKLVWECWLLA